MSYSTTPHPQGSCLRYESQMASKCQHELQDLDSSADPLQRVRLQCLSRGATGILALGRLFRRMEDDEHKNINSEDFLDRLRQFGIDLTEEEGQELFEKFDTGDGHVNVHEFLIHIGPPLSQTRINSINNAFNKIDKNGEGEVTLEALKKAYSVRSDPRYISGEDSQDFILQTFMANFEEDATKDGKVTKEEFFNYYAGISASIDNDCYFDLMMRQSYKM